MKDISLLRLYRNKIILTVMDIVLIFFACFFSMLLIIPVANITNETIVRVGKSALLSIIIYQFYFRLFKVYNNITRYENVKDYLKYISLCGVSYLTIFTLTLLAPFSFFSLRESLVSTLVISLGLIAYRVLIRVYLLNKAKKHTNGIIPKNLLIIGAGNGAIEIMKTIKDKIPDLYNIVGLIDDNPLKWKGYMSGIRVLGDRYKIISACEKYNIEEIFFTISNIKSDHKKEILELCKNTKARVRILPSTQDVIENKNLLQSLKDVDIEDLLGRDPIILDNRNIEDLIANNNILVTGGGGSIGSELCRQIARFNPSKLIVFDIYENNLYNIQLELKHKFPNLNIKAIIGSVRDKQKLESVFEEYQPFLVFHAAAHKHVPLMEESPLEAIKNNVFGTKNIADCADKYKTKRCILISTDKAVNPTNIMGATKRICEMIIQSKAKVSSTEFAAVRFGNVLGSNGSVVPLFKQQIKEGGPLTVTHKEITRFFMTISEAVELVLQAMTFAKCGEIFVLDMGEPVKIYDLAESLIKLSGLRPNVDIPIQITGLRPGEKLYEELLMSEEGLQKTEHNKIFVANPLELTVEEVNKRLDKLEKLTKSEKTTIQYIKEVIRDVVPTFAEPEERNVEVKNYKRELEEKIAVEA